MCLHDTKKIELKSDIGYVVICKDRFAKYGFEQYKVNKKYQAESQNCGRRQIIPYKPGFHYFVNKEDAINYCDAENDYIRFYRYVVYEARFYNSYLEGNYLNLKDTSRVAEFRVLKRKVYPERRKTLPV